MFKTQEQRCQFVESLGTFYAGLGGLFGAYREARPAFEVAQASKLYERVELQEGDFQFFEQGFNKFQSFRVAMQLEKARAQSVMSAILQEVNLTGAAVSEAKHYTELRG